MYNDIGIVPEILEHKVVWFDISMYDATLVECGQDREHLMAIVA